MIRILIVLISLFFLGCNAKDSCIATPMNTIESDGISIDIYDFKGLEPLISKNCDDKIHVINFWATWCKPCVAELPYFERLVSEKDISVTLISLDMPSLIKSKVIPFIKKHQLKSTVLILDDPDADGWIPKVDTDWSGAIPATLILKGDKRKFYEQSFTYESLKEAIEKL